MNFWKKIQTAFDPPPHFWKIILQFFLFFLSFRPQKGWFINYVNFLGGPYSTETSITIFKTVIICPLPQSNDHQFDIPHLPPPPSPKIKIFSKLYMHEKKVLLVFHGPPLIPLHRLSLLRSILRNFVLQPIKATQLIKIVKV